MERISRLFAALALALAALSWVGAPLARAEAEAFKAGDKIEYRSYGKWERGTIIRPLPGGTQVLVREKPSQFFPEGSERAYSLSDVRRPEAVTPKPAPAPGRKGAGEKAAPPAAAGPPLTEAEILAYLRQRLGEMPFGPHRAPALATLGSMIKQRGVAFRYEAVSTFSTQAAKYGLTSEITFPLGDNFGAPTVEKWLMGRWRMDKIGSPVDFVKNGDLYRRMETGARMGMLTLEPGGGYTWMLYANDPPAKHVRGRWRKATPEEMRYQGGDGIVLLKAKDGESWLVRHDRTAPAGDWVCVSHLVYWQQREFGMRMPAARPAPKRGR